MQRYLGLPAMPVAPAVESGKNYRWIVQL